ncbi:L-lactate dehydrogenase (cytochrome) [[Emmonsia] crescens]|uniref:L-lactate dehydrogenase (cytochrome) n=1 Tax=[Emmonsia] crescens TaxID=73230 RepID=A0A2B7ZIM5_9EURO|nr:L-lactate dehydrogenase (cytochrome) [Emmonsia crescens]
MSKSNTQHIPSLEVSAHNAANDCWIVVDNQVWDVTDFLSEHPGGPSIILKYAGRDATKAYSDIHPPSLIKNSLPEDKLKGVLDRDTIGDEWLKEPPEQSVKHMPDNEKPPLSTLINAHDFEVVASKTATAKTWAFYSSASNDLITRDANKSVFDRTWFRPRILRNVKEANTKTKILGCDVNLPLFVSPAAMVKLIHPDGELAIARACETRGVMQGISNSASYSMKDITAAGPQANYFFQLYVNKDRAKSAAHLQECSENPRIRAIFITVDAAWPGKREADERVRADESLSVPMSAQRAHNDAKGGGLGRVMAGFIDPALTWEDLVWARKHTHLPLVLKGVMSADDAMLAMKAGLDGILLSNHGGRNLDTSPPALVTLLELHKRCPEIFDKMEIYVDGGIRRGTDILKAVCLGATAVGMGRSVLFAANYGQEGVEHLFDIMKDELEGAMRLAGITSLDEAHPGLINTADIDHLVPDSASHPYARSVARGRGRTSPPSKLWNGGASKAKL